MHSVRIGKVFGIELRVDWSVVVIFWLLMWQFATIVLPAMAPSYSGLEYWATAFVATAIFLAALAAHELGHSLTARRHGVRVRDITIWMLGGIATLDGMAATPADDLAIAVAGPAASVGIGLAGIVLGIAIAAASAPKIVVAGVMWIATINLVIALFNLAPAAPLDGGRILRAWLWRRSGDRSAATIKATHAGRWFAWFLMVAGFAEFAFGGAVGGLWLIVLGWFVFAASRAEERQEVLVQALGGVHVRDVMTHDPVTAPDSVTVAELVDQYVLRSRGSGFPLVDPHGRVVGLVTLSHCKLVPEDQRAVVRARDIAEPISEVPIASPAELLLDVLQREGHAARILVFDRARLVGIVTPSDVMRVLQRAALRPSLPIRDAA